MKLLLLIALLAGSAYGRELLQSAKTSNCWVFPLTDTRIKSGYTAYGMAAAFCAKKGFTGVGDSQVFPTGVEKTVNPLNGAAVCTSNCQAYQYIECVRNGAAAGCGTVYAPCWNKGFRNKGCNNFGNRNKGDGNVGNNNVGSYNIGSKNRGDGNVGGVNLGNGNQGVNNIGGGNWGANNVGQGNAGAGNTGSGNLGANNVGQGNSGVNNAGQGNSGIKNTGQGTAGCGQAGIGGAGC